MPPMPPIPLPDYTGRPPACARCGEDMELAGIDRENFRTAREHWHCPMCCYHHTRLEQVIVPRRGKWAGL